MCLRFLNLKSCRLVHCMRLFSNFRHLRTKIVRNDFQNVFSDRHKNIFIKYFSVLEFYKRCSWLKVIQFVNGICRCRQ